MKFRTVIASFVMVTALLIAVSPACAETATSPLKQSMSEALDLWREGRFDQLYEHLSHRGKTSKEQFVARMRDVSIRPVCCWQQLENFTVLNEKRTEATVYVKVGLEGMPGTTDSCTREFKMSYEQGMWKMQLTDVFGLAGISGKKGKHASHKKSYKNTVSYH
jgi:hypothetical protein